MIIEPKPKVLRKIPWRKLVGALTVIAGKMKTNGLNKRNSILVGIPRGGVICAIWLSNRTRIPFSDLNPMNGLPNGGKGYVIVDDMVITGNTARRAKEINPEAVLLSPICPQSTPSSIRLAAGGVIFHSGETWFQMPWETTKYVKAELQRYNLMLKPENKGRARPRTGPMPKPKGDTGRMLRRSCGKTWNRNGSFSKDYRPRQRNDNNPS